MKDVCLLNPENIKFTSIRSLEKTFLKSLALVEVTSGLNSLSFQLPDIAVILCFHSHLSSGPCSDSSGSCRYLS